MNKNLHPILMEKINNIIINDELKMENEDLKIWNSIKVDLIKWDINNHGKPYDEFWIAGLIGKNVLWYNDIEDGWNISTWNTYGTINEYWCNQDDLISAIKNIKHLMLSYKRIFAGLCKNRKRNLRNNCAMY